MTEPEKEIEKALRAMVKRHGGLCLKWVCPGWSGVPDRILLFPGGRVYFVETKRPKGGRLSALQRKWQGWLSALGFFAGVAWTMTDVLMLEQIIAPHSCGLSAQTVIFDEAVGGELDEDV